MFHVNRRTYKNLVDEVLQWTGDENDQAQMRTLAKQAVRSAHEKLLTEGRYTFMIFPKVQRFTTSPGERSYSLHEAFLSPVYFYNVTKGVDVRPVPYQRQHEFRDSAQGIFEYVTLHGVSKVKTQPSQASTITATSSNPADNGKTVRVVGETANGIEEEVLSVGGAAGSTQFTTILDVVKEGTDWAGTLSLDASDGTEVLTLSASQYGRQFHQITPINPQNGGEQIEYQFFRHPKLLVHDTDIPDVPYPFDRILTLEALVALSGFTRATANEIREWKANIEELKHALDMQYQDGQAANSEPIYQDLIPR